MVRLPGTEPFTVAAGRHDWTVDVAPVPAAGEVSLASSLAAIMDDPQAYQTVKAAFNRISPTVGREFHRRTAWVPNQPLLGSFSLIAPSTQSEVEISLAALNASRAL